MTKLIIGLGNPGTIYKNTRHNVGFMVLDKLQKEEANFSNWKDDKKSQSKISKAKINDLTIILAKPQTFMNKSGQTVNKLVEYYKIDLENLLVIHDDIDILLGKYKLQREKSSAGHRGIESIINQLNSKDFWRLRIGIARPERKKMGDVTNFVLRNFAILEKKKLKKIIKQAMEEINSFSNL